jgi:superoxide dismutase
MSKKEKTTRTLENLVEDFKSSFGNFQTFNKGMDAREKTIFKGWLNKLRANPAVPETSLIG